jgi:GNAT superfamily N-acetyltransferase
MPPTKLLIGPGREEDAGFVEGCVRGLFAQEGVEVPLFTAGSFRSHGLRAGAFACDVAFLDDRPAGCVLSGPAFDPATGQRGREVLNLFVVPESRRHGVGKALVGAVGRRAARAGGRFLTWLVSAGNSAALAFYRALGAVPLDRQFYLIDGDRFQQLATTPSRGQVAVSDPTQARVLQRLLEEDGSCTTDRTRFEHAGALILLARDQDVPAGYLIASPTYATGCACPAHIVHRVYVAPASRRQRLATALVAEVCRRTCEQGGSVVLCQANSQGGEGVTFLNSLAQPMSAYDVYGIADDPFRELVAGAAPPAPWE